MLPTIGVVYLRLCVCVAHRKLQMSADWARVQWTAQNESPAAAGSDSPSTKRGLQVRQDFISKLGAQSTAEVSTQRRRLGHAVGDRFVDHWAFRP
jgi:hypothetical protein